MRTLKRASNKRRKKMYFKDGTLMKFTCDIKDCPMRQFCIDDLQTNYLKLVGATAEENCGFYPYYLELKHSAL
jgi:hypothetical protein